MGKLEHANYATGPTFARLPKVMFRYELQTFVGLYMCF